MSFGGQVGGFHCLRDCFKDVGMALRLGGHRHSGGIRPRGSAQPQSMAGVPPWMHVGNAGPEISETSAEPGDRRILKRIVCREHSLLEAGVP